MYLPPTLGFAMLRTCNINMCYIDLGRAKTNKLYNKFCFCNLQDMLKGSTSLFLCYGRSVFLPKQEEEAQLGYGVIDRPVLES